MRDDRSRLEDILTAVVSILRFVHGKSRDDLECDSMLQSAVLHQLSVIGEAAKGVSSSTTTKYPMSNGGPFVTFAIRWSHSYFALDLDIVWATIASDLPLLEHHVREILAKEFPGSVQNDS
jgi:uncharacterized protein with HEPN domain